MISTAVMLTRLLVGSALGAIIGYERERVGRPAGLRTHLLVGVASSTFMLVSTQFVYYQNYHAGDLVAIDTSRIAASVVAGVGFLGAGAILRTGFGVRGLTTAASLWLVAALGLAAGGGMYDLAFAGVLIAMIGLIFLRRLEDKENRTPGPHGKLRVRVGTRSIGAVIDELRKITGLIVHGASVEIDSKLAEITVDLEPTVAADAVLARLTEFQGAEFVSLDLKTNGSGE